jgi:hypothetical protein
MSNDVRCDRDPSAESTDSLEEMGAPEDETSNDASVELELGRPATSLLLGEGFCENESDGQIDGLYTLSDGEYCSLLHRISREMNALLMQDNNASTSQIGPSVQNGKLIFSLEIKTEIWNRRIIDYTITKRSQPLPSVPNNNAVFSSKFFRPSIPNDRP